MHINSQQMGGLVVKELISILGVPRLFTSDIGCDQWWNIETNILYLRNQHMLGAC
jgi:hypothetical protein